MVAQAIQKEQIVENGEVRITLNVPVPDEVMLVAPMRPFTGRFAESIAFMKPPFRTGLPPYRSTKRT